MRHRSHKQIGARSGCQAPRGGRSRGGRAAGKGKKAPIAPRQRCRVATRCRTGGAGTDRGRSGARSGGSEAAGGRSGDRGRCDPEDRRTRVGRRRGGQALPGASRRSRGSGAGCRRRVADFDARSRPAGGRSDKRAARARVAAGRSGKWARASERNGGRSGARSRSGSTARGGHAEWPLPTPAIRSLTAARSPHLPASTDSSHPPPGSHDPPAVSPSALRRSPPSASS